MRGLVPTLPGPEARLFADPCISWLERTDEEWRGWSGPWVPGGRGVWRAVEDAEAEYRLQVTADGDLPWRAALKAMANVLWPDEPDLPEDEMDLRRTEREDFVDRMTEREWKSAKRFGVLPDLRRRGDVEGLLKIAAQEVPDRDSIRAIELLAYLALEGHHRASVSMLRLLEHPHHRVRSETIDCRSYVAAMGRSLHSPADLVGMRHWKLEFWTRWPRFPAPFTFPAIRGDRTFSTVTPWLRFEHEVRMALRDVHPGVRCVGLRYAPGTVFEGGDGRDIVVAAATEDASPEVRIYAYRALKFNRYSGIDALALRLLEDPDDVVRSAAMTDVAAMPGVAPLKALLAAASRSEPPSFEAVCSALTAALERPSLDAKSWRSIEAVVLGLSERDEWRKSMYLYGLLDAVGGQSCGDIYDALSGDESPEVSQALSDWQAHLDQIQAMEAEEAAYAAQLCPEDE